MYVYYLTSYVKPKTAFVWKMGEDTIPEEFMHELLDKTEMPFSMKLVDYNIKGNKAIINDDISQLKYTWLDYPPNNLCWPIFSPRLTEVIDNKLTGKEGIIWMKLHVESKDESREYFVPRFEKPLDVLDMEKSTFGVYGDSVAIPVFSRRKIENYSMFAIPFVFWQITSSICVKEDLKKEIKKHKFTGVNFETYRLV